MAPQLTSHRVDLQGYSIFYQQGRLRSSVPLLFLHGWGISTEPYQEVLERLARQHSLIAPDLPSFAQSSYSNLIADYETYANFLLSFLDALEIDQVHLAGHSLGGGIAIALAAIAPEKVKSIVLIDSTGIPTDLLSIVPRRAIEMVAQVSLPKLKLQFFDIPKVFSQNLLFNTGNVLQALLLSLQADLQPLLPKITAPCLLLWSEKDLTTPLTNAYKMAELISNSRVTTVTEGWHEWALWYPEKFAAIVLDFVQEYDRAV